ncbi:outer membrane lipoprotein chaperone LolA [Chitinasiproducens palmae]|uniref:Outer-membrane lipoprotein carrier protein n=1 Tax=Chitinasiproducens palmae TaxID=1770053 RepID=A0A1H2PMR3_9BURK|nr:outer membrane lipoprotein chaperone LolA [Chitinasiproducens palmae]SDV47957.1 outer membrane lipoprotein carrier protein [Chitinasiproducens palmae]
MSAHFRAVSPKPYAGPLRRATLVLAGVAAALCIATPAFAGGIEQLKTFVAQVKTARGDFVQKQVKTGGQANGQSAGAQGGGTATGNFVFSRPGRFVWHYNKPYEQLLQADGKTLYVYDKDLNQVTERALGDALGASPAAILFGSNEIEKSFNLKDAGAQDGVEKVELTPKANDTQFERIIIGFRQGTLDTMELRDVFGNVTMLTFANIQRNPALDSNTFRFTPPKGADVVKG